MERLIRGLKMKLHPMSQGMLEKIVKDFMENYLEYYRRDKLREGHVSKYQRWGYPLYFPYWDFYIHLKRLGFDVDPKEVTDYLIRKVRKIIEKMGYSTRGFKSHQSAVEDKDKARLFERNVEVDRKLERDPRGGWFPPFSEDAELIKVKQ